MAFTRLVLGWLATWLFFLAWEAVEARMAGGPKEPGRTVLRRAPGAYFIEALLLALIAGLWFASLATAARGCSLPSSGSWSSGPAGCGLPAWTTPPSLPCSTSSSAASAARWRAPSSPSSWHEHGVGGVRPRAGGGIFAPRNSRPALLAREALGRAAPGDAAAREALVQGLQQGLRPDGSVGGAAIPTIWRAIELMELGHSGQEPTTARLVGWVLATAGQPGAFGEGCHPARHEQKACEHYLAGFFAPAPAGERLAPITLPCGKTFRAEAQARFAVSCLGLRAVIQAGLAGRASVKKHLTSLSLLAEVWTDWGGYWAPDLVASALHPMASAPPVHRGQRSRRRRSSRRTSARTAPGATPTSSTRSRRCSRPTPRRPGRRWRVRCPRCWRCSGRTARSGPRRRRSGR